MGRPLKISKAHAYLTITDTASATDEVTVSQTLADLGVTAGMSFVPATSTGGLTGGTTYWILKLTAANKFTVSATTLTANPTETAVDLSSTTGTTVVASVGLVDTLFNNPAGSGNTYGVVGGNTASYGKQILANVAIGVNGVGTIYTSGPTTLINGIGTDFGNTMSIGSWVGTTDGTTVGYVTAVNGPISVDVTAATASSDQLTVSDSSNLPLNGAIQLDVNIGGLTANTVYFVKTKPSGTAITVSATMGGATIQLNDETVAASATHDSVTIGTAPAVNVSNVGYTYATPELGFVLRQKGKTKYLVQGATTGLVGACYTANVASAALTANTLNFIATYANTSTSYVKSLSDRQAKVFSTTVSVGSLVAGTAYTIEDAGNTDWTAVGAHASMTGITFTATGTGSGTGTAVLTTNYPSVIGTFNSAVAANVADGRPQPLVTITNS